MLSKKTKYAIKALMILAKTNAEEEQMRISEISEVGKIPRKFLEAILLELRKNGLLGSKMGANGGYYLLKSPSDIYLTEVIRLTDGPIALLPCASLNFYEKCLDCEDEVTCGIKKVMTEVRISTLMILSNTSIADLIKKESRLLKSKLKKVKRMRN
ncbi:MAG: Rrf2 family transcriptional regulator [Bacteroidetes bacterium]|jgi:Rrf2 family protein|nr:Rrf2 family transcriptional regulator [Bacteroidota bacterium]MCA6444019.1 Rrf2 family transcriptional regulator [Bacteroidota bacterium]